MSFATLANIATMLFCAAVLVQSVRMMRSLRAVKEGGLADVVGALDRSTMQARSVLSELRTTLGECGINARRLSDARDVVAELEVMIGIANASAERLLEAATTARRIAPEPVPDEEVAA